VLRSAVCREAKTSANGFSHRHVCIHPGAACIDTRACIRASPTPRPGSTPESPRPEDAGLSLRAGPPMPSAREWLCVCNT